MNDNSFEQQDESLHTPKYGDFDDSNDAGDEISSTGHTEFDTAPALEKEAVRSEVDEHEKSPEASSSDDAAANQNTSTPDDGRDSPNEASTSLKELPSNDDEWLDFMRQDSGTNEERGNELSPPPKSPEPSGGKVGVSKTSSQKITRCYLPECDSTSSKSTLW